MFGFLKDKLKSAISVFSKKAEEEAKDVDEQPEEKKPEKKPASEEKKHKEGKNKAEKESKELSKKEPEKKKEEPKKETAKKEEKQPEKKSEVKKKEVSQKETSSEKTIEEKHVVTKKNEKIESLSPSVPVTYPEDVESAAQQSIKEDVHTISEEPKPEEKKGFFSRLKEKFSKKAEETEKDAELQKTEEKEAEEIEEIQEQQEPVSIEVPEKKPEPVSQKPTPKPTPQPIAKPVVEEPEEKKGFFSKIGDTFSKKTLSAEKFEELFWEIEVALLESNVAVSVIEKIKQDLKDEMVDKKVGRFEIAEIVQKGLSKSVREILTSYPVDILERIEAKRKEKEPFVMCFVGVNGAGKTTTIAKFANFLKKNNYTCVVAAADTFRAAALEQLQTHTDNLGLKLIKHDYGSDAAAVAFDALAYAKQKNFDVVLIDTAGRLHSNVNLMGELEKVIRVSKADFVMFVGDALTGNDAVEQAEKYNSLVGVDGIILAKADVDEKGGATISTSYVIQKPVMFLGVGQGYDDFEQFDAEKILVKLGLQ